MGARMVRRMNMTRPRVRLAEGKDPTAAINRIYGASQLDFPKGNVRVNRDGEMVGGPVGFDGRTAGQKNQFPEDRHGKSYDNDTSGWQHGGDASESRPGFDNYRNHHHFKEARGLKASDKDASKSPFSAAYFKGRGEG